MGSAGGLAFDFKGQPPRTPRSTPSFPDKLAHELAQPSTASRRTKVIVRSHLSNAAVLTGSAYRSCISTVCIGDCLKPSPDLGAFRTNETEPGRGSFRQRFTTPPASCRPNTNPKIYNSSPHPRPNPAPRLLYIQTASIRHDRGSPRNRRHQRLAWLPN